MSSGGVMLTGWLRKSPPENKLKSRHHVRSWKKRWFVLKSGRLTGDPNVLEYSKYQTSKKPIKIIDLNDCQKVDINVNIPVKGDKKDRDGNQHFIFSIVTSHRTFYLIADSKREMSSWVQCLCELCGFNYDSATEQDCIGNKQRTFMASPTSLVVHSPGGSVTTPMTKESSNESSAEQNAEKAPTHHYSKPQYQNGNINTSFQHSSHNGYDNANQEAVANNRDHIHNGAVHYLNNSFGLPPPRVVMDPSHSMNSAEDTEYLHLVDCETAQGSTLQLIDKGDQRRCSTDSVFTHEESKLDDDSVFTNEKSKLEDHLPDMRRMAPRFLEGGRLDSMPNVPPPAPPIGADPLGDLDFDDDDDEVVEARRPSKYSTSRGTHGFHENVYNTPARVAQKVPDDSLPWQSRSGSSFGSVQQLQSIEYVNTLSSKFSSSMSTASDMLDSPYSANGPLSISSSTSSRLLHESTNPNSPIFPILHVKPHPDSSNMHSHKDTFSIDNTQIVDVQRTLERQELEAQRIDQMPPARPPKPSELIHKGNSHSLDDGRDAFTGPVSPKHASIIGIMSNQANSEPQSLLLPTMPQSGFHTPVSSLNTSRSSVPTIHSASPEDSDMSIYDTPKPNIYDTPRPLKPNLLKKNDDHPGVLGNNVDIGSNPEIDDIENPGYEKMCGGGYMSTDAPCDDAGINFYTPMAATGPRFPMSSTMMGLPAHAPPNSDLNYIPPPVNRDLKPGRKSLGSDGGSSHSGPDMRKNSGRDSFTSDEGLSPPHTMVIPSPQLGERAIHNHPAQSPVQINGGSLSPWNISSRPPRPGHGSNLPPSPLVSPNLSQPTRSPVHSTLRITEKNSSAPERPPKPLSMKYPTVADDNPIPPRRPPKPGDTHFNRKPVPTAMPSAIVVPPAEMPSDIQYIEVLPQHPRPVTAQEKFMDNDLVEYTDIDSSKTRALEKSKRERQGIMLQKTNPD